MLAAIVAAAIAASGMSCAAIDNGPNTASWARPGHGIVTTTYRDRGDHLQFRAHVPRGRTLEALKRAEDALQIGEPGHKVVVACA